jgi:hypothetical protein
MNTDRIIEAMNTRPTPETDKFFATFADGEAAPSHAEYYARLQDLERERDEAREYADKLAEGLPDGMLPKDVEVLREANTGLAVELATVIEQRDKAREIYQKSYTAELARVNHYKQQRDRLAEALREIRKGITEPTHHRRGTLEIANEALAAVKGGSE